MATRRQREAAAPRPAANAGPRNWTGAAAAAARSGPSRKQTAAGAARSGPRIQTAATATATAPSGPRNQTAAAAAAATCRPHARDRRALGDIGNHVNATDAVDREANRRRLTRSLSARRNAAMADENTIAPGSCSSCSSGGAGASRAVSGENKKLTKGSTSTISVTRTRANKTDATVDSLMERVAAAEAEIVRAVEKTESIASMYQVLHDKYVKLTGDYLRYISEATQTADKLHAMVDKKESELQKVLDLNVRLSCVVDLREAQLQAMSEQCKALALNSD